MKTHRMKVVLVETGKQAQVKTVSAELCDLQNLFADEIKVHYQTSDSIALIFDNYKIETSEDGEKYFVVTGSLIVCGVAKNKFCSLTPGQQVKYLEQFSKCKTVRKICWRADTQKGK